MYLGIKKRPNIIFVKISNSLNFQDDIKKPLGIGSTVTYTCFQIAAFAKVNSVNIVGVDHNFTLSSDKKNKEHNIELLKGDDVNHFDPNYFKGNFWGLPDLKASEEAFVVAKEYFLNKKTQIIDYTINGKLQTFTKGVISNLYKK